LFITDTAMTVSNALGYRANRIIALTDYLAVGSFHMKSTNFEKLPHLTHDLQKIRQIWGGQVWTTG